MKESIQLAKRFFEEVWKPPHNLEAIDDLMTDDYVIVSGGNSIKGKHTFKEWVANFLQKLLDAENEHLDIFESADGQKVVSRWICKGRNNGLMGTEPDGREVTFTGIAIWEVKEGRLAKCWVERAGWELYQDLTK